MNMNIWVLLQMVDLEIVTANRKVYELSWVKPKVKILRYEVRLSKYRSHHILDVKYNFFFGLFLDRR